MSHVTYQVTGVACHKKKKIVKLVGEGLLSTGPTPSGLVTSTFKFCDNDLLGRNSLQCIAAGWPKFGWSSSGLLVQTLAELGELSGGDHATMALNEGRG